jgi:prepilin-type N-terminal cleavage/methylation domain-containing protein/prepilin-type processing-associated H-X9-DG protein
MIQRSSKSGWKGTGFLSIHPFRKCGFTLIELLVVIAIISLLVSILIPSLQKARMLARQVVCLTRLKAIGSAYYLYKNDFDDVGPIGFTYGDGHNRGDWSNYPPGGNPYNGYFGWYKGKTTHISDAPYNDTPCWALGEYLGITDDRKTIVATCCPNWYDWFIATAADGGLLNTTAPTSYAVNWYLGYDTHLGDHLLKSPASTPMLMDGMGENFNSGDGSIKPYYMVFPRASYQSTFSGEEFTSMSETTHDYSANYLLFDGHAENQPATKDPDDSLSHFNQIWNWYCD